MSERDREGESRKRMNAETPTTRQRVLRNAEGVVSQDRNKTYGGPEQSFQVIAELWSVLFGHVVTADQVALAMALLKIARLQSNPLHYDSWVDLAGYAACGAEVSDRMATVIGDELEAN